MRHTPCSCGEAHVALVFELSRAAPHRPDRRGPWQVLSIAWAGKATGWAMPMRRSSRDLQGSNEQGVLVQQQGVCSMPRYIILIALQLAMSKMSN